MSPQPYIDAPFNQILAQKHEQVRNAQRLPLGTVCDAKGEAKTTPAAKRRQLKTIQINGSGAATTIIPGGQAGTKLIMEVVLWNATAAQTLTFQQGSAGTNPIVLLKLTNFPASTGFTLGFNGNWDMAHWEIDNGQPLVLTSSGSGQVDGFVRYRVQN